MIGTRRNVVGGGWGGGGSYSYPHSGHSLLHGCEVLGGGHPVLVEAQALLHLLLQLLAKRVGGHLGEAVDPAHCAFLLISSTGQTAACLPSRSKLSISSPNSYRFRDPGRCKKQSVLQSPVLSAFEFHNWRSFARCKGSCCVCLQNSTIHRKKEIRAEDFLFYLGRSCTQDDSATCGNEMLLSSIRTLSATN